MSDIAVYVSEDRCVVVWVVDREDGEPPVLSVATR